MDSISQLVLDEDIKYCAMQPYMKGFSGKTVAVIGGTGMIGSYILRVLIAYNSIYEGKCTIIGLCRDLNKAKKLFCDDWSKVEWVIGDVCDSQLEWPNFDYLIYAAGYTDDGICDARPVDIYRVNTLGIHIALEHMYKNGGKRLCFVSSAAVYEGVKKVGLLQETNYGVSIFNQPENVYGQSKRMGECICRCYAKQYGVDVIVVRPFHMYGAGMILTNSNLVYSSIKCAVNKEIFIMNSEGNVKRNFSYLRDIIAQILLILTAKELKYDLYNLGTENNTIQVKEWVNLLCNLADMKVVFLKQTNKNVTNGMSLCPDTNRINELLKLCSSLYHETDIRTGIERTLQFYESTIYP